MHRAPISVVIWFAAATLSPLLLWAAAASAVRRRPGLLPQLYYWLRPAAWIAWLATVVAFTIPLVASNFRSPAWLCVAGFCSGILLIHDWARRKVKASNGKVSPENWRPESKNL